MLIGPNRGTGGNTITKQLTEGYQLGWDLPELAQTLRDSMRYDSISHSLSPIHSSPALVGRQWLTAVLFFLLSISDAVTCNGWCDLPAPVPSSGQFGECTIEGSAA